MLERFTTISAGFRAVLRSDGVRADLERRAQAVAQQANSRLADLDAPYPPVVVDVTIGASRAGATIVGVPLPLEQSRRILGSAVDAAGG